MFFLLKLISVSIKFFIYYIAFLVFGQQSELFSVMIKLYLNRLKPIAIQLFFLFHNVFLLRLMPVSIQFFIYYIALLIASGFSWME